jgi:hypothetical protein
VRSVAPLVREAIARANDFVILRESDIRLSLDVIHSLFFHLNSDSSRRGGQKSVSPLDEKIRLVVGRYEWYVNTAVHCKFPVNTIARLHD